MNPTPTSNAARRDELTAASGMYRLLARLWLQEVDLPLLNGLATPPLAGRFRQAGGVLPEAVDKESVESLAIEFCKLLVGPVDHLPPFQSVWQTGQFQSQAITSMQDFMQVVGYDADSVPAGIMPDHLGMQFAVMGHLAYEHAITPPKSAQANALLEVSQSFFIRHLTWPSPLFNAAERRTNSEFYRSVVALTRNFLRSEERYWRPSDCS